ncbi:hypothetical protein [Acrocarpospora sp. B8E8]|uniref:hypothetical protein n=1 Tax=Acrocarpospora sp. B8E8 TaxID=3153572 RepID=UPI00325D5B96
MTWTKRTSCDYVVNGWLVEMGVGEMPEGLLRDPELRGLSCEAVYDRITGDLRRLRKLSAGVMRMFVDAWRLPPWQQVLFHPIGDIGRIENRGCHSGVRRVLLVAHPGLCSKEMNFAK